MRERERARAQKKTWAPCWLAPCCLPLRARRLQEQRPLSQSRTARRAPLHSRALTTSHLPMRPSPGSVPKSGAMAFLGFGWNLVAWFCSGPSAPAPSRASAPAAPLVIRSRALGPQSESESPNQPPLRTSGCPATPAWPNRAGSPIVSSTWVSASHGSRRVSSVVAGSRAAHPRAARLGYRVPTNTNHTFLQRSLFRVATGVSLRGCRLGKRAHVVWANSCTL